MGDNQSMMSSSPSNSVHMSRTSSIGPMESQDQDTVPSFKISPPTGLGKDDSLLEMSAVSSLPLPMPNTAPIWQFTTIAQNQQM